MKKILDHLENKSDEELVKLSLETADNFAYIIQLYEKKLFSYIYRITNVSKEEVEDILQDVFIKVYKNLNDFDMGLKFSSWIYRIAHNQVISNYRAKKSRGEEVSFEINERVLEVLSSDLDMEKEVDFDYLRKNINHILEKMDQKHSEILVLKFLEEKSYKEISDILKMPMGTVAVNISRAKKQFRETIANNDIKI